MPNPKMTVSITVAILTLVIIAFQTIPNGCTQESANLNVGVDMTFNTPAKTYQNDYLPLLQEAGLQIVRLEFNNGSLNNLRALTQSVVQGQMQVLGVLIRTDLAPDNHTYFGEWVYDVVSEFKKYVHVWEIWNEPNLEEFFPSRDPSKYVDFLHSGYVAAKSADPNCFVLGGSVVFTHDTALNFFENIYQKGGKEYMDAPSYHPYCTPHPPDENNVRNPFVDLVRVREIMARYEDFRQLWITECGWTTNEEGAVGEINQASYTFQALNMAKEWGWVNTFIIYNWKDTGTSGSATKGLLRNDLTPKPSFYAVKDFIQNSQTSYLSSTEIEQTRAFSFTNPEPKPKNASKSVKTPITQPQPETAKLTEFEGPLPKQPWTTQSSDTADNMDGTQAPIESDQHSVPKNIGTNEILAVCITILLASAAPTVILNRKTKTKPKSKKELVR